MQLVIYISLSNICEEASFVKIVDDFSQIISEVNVVTSEDLLRLVVHIFTSSETYSKAFQKSKIEMFCKNS